MKNVCKLLLPVLLLVAGYEVKAADVFDVKVSGDRILTVELEKVEEGTVLFFQDKNGEILFQDKLTLTGQYKKSFNLEVIPNGVYHLVLEKENIILTSEVIKTRNGLELSGKSSKTLFKPYFKVENKLVQVFLTNPEEGTAYFKVYDRRGKLVNSMAYNDLVVQKTFDFSQVPAGEYTITVKIGDKIFSRSIVLG